MQGGQSLFSHLVALNRKGGKVVHGHNLLRATRPLSLDGMNIDGATARRWAPIAVALIPRFRELLMARRAVH